MCGVVLSSLKEITEFYTRFDIQDFNNECNEVIRNLSHTNNPIVITIDEVVNALKHVKVGKSAGPDNISAKVVKHCARPLALPLHKLYQTSLNTGIVPALWKLSEIIPVPKIAFPKVSNDYRPVALTSIIMKCLEHIVKRHLCTYVDHLRDPAQFAYCKGRSVQDATLTLLHEIYEHLESPNTYVRLLYIDFSSAFNTMQPIVLLRKLCNMNVNSVLIKWIHNYLSCRTQYVKCNNTKSNVRITNTGAPQGCVLSPLLFTLYTNDCSSIHRNCSIFKYADDTVLLGLIQSDDVSNYISQVDHFIEWCGLNYLNINVNKTKEMLIDFRKNRAEPAPLVINSMCVERVTEYKYLGIIIDNKLSGSPNTQRVYSKAAQRLHHLYILHRLSVDRKLVTLVYKSFVESVLCFSITIWYKVLSVKDKAKLKKIVKRASKLKATTKSLDKLYDDNTLAYVQKIMKDDTHPLHGCYKFLRSGKRLALPIIRTTRYKNSFIPSSIKLYNYINW